MIFPDLFFPFRKAAPQGPTCGTEPTPETLKKMQDAKRLQDFFDKGPVPPWYCGGVQPVPMPMPYIRPCPTGPAIPVHPHPWVCGGVNHPMAQPAPFGQPQGFSR